MYRLIQFGAVKLDYYNQVDAIGSGETPVSYQILPDGGALDGYGNTNKHPGAVERVKSVRLHGATRAQLEERFFEIMAMRGKRDQLYRRTASGETHRQYARLAAIEGDNDFGYAKYSLIQDIVLRFITQEATWRGDLHGEWLLDSGIYLDGGFDLDSGDPIELTSSPAVITVYNGSTADAGRAPVRSMQIMVITGTVPIQANSLSISRAGGETVEYIGAIGVPGVSSELIIDTGTMQVTVNGVDAYASFDLSPTADMGGWFTLEPGANTITVEFTKDGAGTNPTIEFVFEEAWY